LKPAPFVYHAPATLDEALRLLGTHPNARPLAGGQSLVPLLNFRLAAPDHIVDLNPIASLAYIRGESGHIAIGAMTRQREIERSELVGRRLPLLAQAIRLVGHRQTRTRGTLGGSLAHLDPAAELPAVAAAYDAEIAVRGARGERQLRFAELAKGALCTSLRPEELITEVRFKPWPAGHGHAFMEFARRHGDFAVCSAAALVVLKEGKLDRVSLTLGGVAVVPMRVAAAEAILTGAEPSAALIQSAASRCAEVEALEDPAYPAWYRRKLAVTLARRALEQAIAQ
jgi:carbon-monoxide dehydrogenase medium subunit